MKAGGIQLIMDAAKQTDDIVLHRKVAFALANMLIDCTIVRRMSLTYLAYNGKKLKVQHLELVVDWLNSKDIKLLSGTTICVANLSNADDMDLREKLSSLGVVQVLAELLVKYHSYDETHLQIQKGVTMVKITSRRS